MVEGIAAASMRNVQKMIEVTVQELRYESDISTDPVWKAFLEMEKGIEGIEGVEDRTILGVFTEPQIEFLREELSKTGHVELGSPHSFSTLLRQIVSRQCYQKSSNRLGDWS